MLNLKAKELTRAKQLMRESKFVEALQILNELEKKEVLSLQEQFDYHHLKGSLLFEQGFMDEALKYAELAYNESRKLKNNLLTLDTIFTKINIFRYSGRRIDALKNINKAEELLNILNQISSIQFKEKKAYIRYLKSFIYYQEGDLNKAIKHGQKGLQLANELNNKRLIMLNVGCLATIHSWKGEFDIAQKYNKQRLKIAKDLNDKQQIIGALNNIGTVFRDLGDLNQAMKYIKQSLILCNEIKSFKTPAILDTLCRLAIETDSFDTAQECLDSMKVFTNQRDKKNLLGYDIYNLSKALVLKQSPNDVERLKAKELFKKELEKEEADFESKIVALLNLCALNLRELHQTNNIKILDDINLYIQQTLNIAKEQKSYLLLAETHLLQAKLKLLIFELKEAQKLLITAQDIGKKYDLALLVDRINKEQDELVNEMGKWEKMRNSKAIMSERIDLAHIEVQLNRMLKKRFSLKGANINQII